MSDVYDWLRVLDLEPGVSFEDVRRAHRDMAKVWHPDRFPNDPRLREKAEEHQKAINEAFANLKAWVQSGHPLPVGAGPNLPPPISPAIRGGAVPAHSRNPMRDTWTIRPPLGYRGGVKRVRKRRRRVRRLGVTAFVFVVVVATILVGLLL